MILNLHFKMLDTVKHIGVRAGGGGVRGSAAPPATEIMSFFRQNAHDLGMDTCEKTMQNNAVGVISKTHK